MADHTKVGEILTSDQPRDAIHIAVACVVAATKLDPGQTIGFAEKGNTSEVCPCEPAMSVGIVDPFLTSRVHEGQRFYMFLHPNTITSLKHNWTHPAFGKDDGDDNSASMTWMKRYAENYGQSYRDMVQAGKNWIESGDYFCDGGTFEGERVSDEYWIHFEKITHMRVPSEDRKSFFTCSC